MERAAGRSLRYLRRDNGRNARENGARTPPADGPSEFRFPDLGAIVDCLLAAHYPDDEILDYLTGPLGCSDAEAVAILAAARSA
jgi:hypothetical protein